MMKQKNIYCETCRKRVRDYDRVTLLGSMLRTLSPLFFVCSTFRRWPIQNFGKIPATIVSCSISLSASSTRPLLLGKTSAASSAARAFTPWGKCRFSITGAAGGGAVKGAARQPGRRGPGLGGRGDVHRCACTCSNSKIKISTAG